MLVGPRGEQEEEEDRRNRKNRRDRRDRRIRRSRMNRRNIRSRSNRRSRSNKRSRNNTRRKRVIPGEVSRELPQLLGLVVIQPAGLLLHGGGPVSVVDLEGWGVGGGYYRVVFWSTLGRQW